MPNSYTYFKTDIREWFKNNVSTSDRILDVGPGQGTYSILLRDLGYQMDAVEVWAPYVEQFNLRAKYDNVYTVDIRDFDLQAYDFIILGDVLEHLPVEDAEELLTTIDVLGIGCMVAIPYMMPQDGAEYGNDYETHHQPDLTPDIMLKRYPNLKPLYTNQWYGYYINSKFVYDKAYVLYATESYKDTVQACVDSIRTVSKIPVYVYMLNSNVQIDGAHTFNWMCDVIDVPQNRYINRGDKDIYNILIQRPLIVKNALNNVKTVAYIDSDSVATKYIDTIFDYFPERSTHPYFVEGIYDWMIINGKGGVENRLDMSGSLEHPACQLFGVDQSIRDRYRQTGYFVAGQWCKDFLDEWWWMCNHPKLMRNHEYYAPYHEETVANILLWKYKALDGLPYLYINGSLDTVNNVKFYGHKKHTGHFVASPAKEEHLLFYHGEKDPLTMYRMIERQRKKINVLFLAPHLSTGGMPAFLLKRIEAIKDHVNVYVVEHANHSAHYIVQKEKIKQLVEHFWTLEENKLELIDIIKNNNIDIVHIDDVSESFSNELMMKLYANDRTWKIVETCHNISFNPDKEKRFHPDMYAFCTPYHLRTYEAMPSEKTVIEFPIDPSPVPTPNNKRKVVLNVGLWAPWKNQAEALEIARKYPHMDFWFVGNQAPNFKHYWEPLMQDVPANVTIWGERSDVSEFMMKADIFMFNSTWECNPLVLREAISYGLPIVARNLPQYENMFARYLHPIDTNLNLIEPNSYTIPTDNTIETFRNKHVELYNKVKNMAVRTQSPDKITIFKYFVLNPFLEIRGASDSDFKVEFYDEKDVCIYSNIIKVNSWVKLNRSYFTKWHVKVWENDVLIHDEWLNYENKRVYIAFDSKSLGDTIAWMPYVEEFKKKHNCHVILSTHKNWLFKDVYPEIEFVEPGTVVNNIMGMYKIGWFYNSDMEPVLPNTIPLQQTATNILGLEYKEIKPRIAFTPGENLYGKYITIATNSTAGCKFWTKEGWQAVITYLTNKGYRVINVSKERNPFNGVMQIPEDLPMSEVMSIIHHSEFFIGLSSGLSWLAWALDKQVVMISNFTEDNHEFDCIRVTKKNVCHGCWNSPEHTFDKGDWDWCPLHKGTPRQFECHRSITAQDVISCLPLNRN